jgi:uroporphyrinogen decarboxylase
VLETIRILARELGEVPLIGFAGAPFTVASYLVEGRPSKDYAHTKAMMYGDEAAWHALMDVLADIVTTHLRAQVAAGARAVQLFDSWAGALLPADYERYVLPWSRRILEGLADLDVPRIHFGVGTGELLGLMAAAAPTSSAWTGGSPSRWAVPASRPAPPPRATWTRASPWGRWTLVDARVRDLLDRIGDRPDHVFNLGHGVLPMTDPGVLAHVVDLVHAEGRTGS